MEKVCIKCKKTITTGKYYKSKTGKFMCNECFNKLKIKQNQPSQKAHHSKPSTWEDNEVISNNQYNRYNQNVAPQQYQTWSDNDIQNYPLNYQHPQIQDIYCPICNSKISSNDDFCQNCGAKINHLPNIQNQSSYIYQNQNQINNQSWYNYNQNSKVIKYNYEKRIDVKGITGAVLITFVIIMLFLCFFLPWYSANFEYEDEDYWSRSKTDYYLTKLSWDKRGSDDFDASEDLEYDELRNYSNAEEILEPFDNAKTFSIIILIFSIICLIFVLVYLSNTINPKAFRIIGEIFCIIIFIFCLITVFLFAYQITENLESMVGGGSIGEVKNAGFWFSKSEDGYSKSSGPGLSWYIVFICGILNVITSICLFKKGSIINTTQW